MSGDGKYIAAPAATKLSDGEGQLQFKGLYDVNEECIHDLAASPHGKLHIYEEGTPDNVGAPSDAKLAEGKCALQFNGLYDFNELQIQRQRKQH